MTTATDTITSGFIIPSTTKISVGPAQQTQQAASHHTFWDWLFGRSERRTGGDEAPPSDDRGPPSVGNDYPPDNNDRDNSDRSGDYHYGPDHGDSPSHDDYRDSPDPGDDGGN